MKKITIALIVFIGMTTNSNAATITHYEIDFGSPTHSVGSSPAMGTSPDTVSYIPPDWFGNPTIENSFGSLSNQPLVLRADTFDEPDKIKLNLGLGYDNYHVSFDLETANLVNSLYAFRVLFDTPSVQTLDFHGDNGVRTFNSSFGIPSLYGSAGSFSDNELIKVNIDIDLQSNLWMLNVGSLPTFTSTFYADGNDVTAIRMSLGEWRSNSAADPSIAVGIDNIIVSSTVVPIPAAAWLFGSGLIGLVGFARRKKA